MKLLLLALVEAMAHLVRTEEQRLEQYLQTIAVVTAKLDIPVLIVRLYHHVLMLQMDLLARMVELRLEQ